MLRVQFPGQKEPMSIIQIYTPADVARKETRDKYYEELNNTIENVNNHIFIMGDINGQIGADSNETNIHIIGKLAPGNLNDNGQRIRDFAIQNNFYIMNTFLKKIENRK